METMKDKEDESVGAGFKLFFSGKRQHHLGARLPDQVGNGNELVAIGAKSVDDLWQRGKGLAAIAAAVVQENNIAFVRLPQNTFNNLFSGDRLAIPLAPVIPIDARVDKQGSDIQWF